MYRGSWSSLNRPCTSINQSRSTERILPFTEKPLRKSCFMAVCFSNYLRYVYITGTYSAQSWGFEASFTSISLTSAGTQHSTCSTGSTSIISSFRTLFVLDFPDVLLNPFLTGIELFLITAPPATLLIPAFPISPRAGRDVRAQSVFEPEH